MTSKGLQNRKRVMLSWSSGKDSAWTLYQLQQSPDYEVVALFSTLNQQFDRVAMHGVRNTLLQAQASATGLPLEIVYLPWPCSNQDYEQLMSQALEDFIKRYHIEVMAFGDLHLEDIRRYREKNLASTPLEPLFPLWGMDVSLLAREMIDGGLQAVLTCIDPKQSPFRIAGQAFDHALLDSLPATIDHCGENGEFHTFVHAGPMFQQSIAILAGEIVERDNFIYADFSLLESQL